MIMKKKIIVLLLVVALIPSAIFANDILQLGLNVGYKPTLSQMMEGGELDDYFKWEYFTFAPELKLNLFFIDFDASAYFNFGNNAILIDTQLASDLYFKLSVVKLALGVGINMPFLYSGDTWTMNGHPLDEAGAAFMNANLAYRAGLGLDFGKFNMMVNYSVPTKGTFSNPDFAPRWDGGQFSLGLLIDLF